MEKATSFEIAFRSFRRVVSVRVTAARITSCFLTGLATLFGRLREGHVRTENAENTATVDGALEAAQRTVNRLVVANFNAYGQGDPLVCSSVCESAL
jgi:hypothetical protein